MTNKIAAKKNPARTPRKGEAMSPKKRTTIVPPPTDGRTKDTSTLMNDEANVQNARNKMGVP
jgi:hypothetical protein